MDVVALAQFGIDFAVATLGTALTGQHLDRLSRQTAQVIVCFDGDKAGRTAAKRALDTMLPFLSDEFSIRFLFLPDGHDPDSLVRAEGTESFLSQLNDALPASEALIRLLSDDVDLTKIDGRARLTALALPKIAKIPASIYRSLMLDSLSERSGTRRTDLDARLQDLHIEPAVIENTSTKISQQHESSEIVNEMESFESLRPNEEDQLSDFSEDVEPPIEIEDEIEVPQKLQFPDPDKPEPLANRLLWLMLQNPALLREPFSIPERSRLVNVHALGQVFDWVTSAEKPTTAGLMGHFSGTELGRLLSKLLGREALFSECTYEPEFKDGLNQLKKQLVTESMRLLAEDAKRGKISAEDLHQALAAHKK
jgi:DNA primase